MIQIYVQRKNYEGNISPVLRVQLNMNNSWFICYFRPYQLWFPNFTLYSASATLVSLLI